MIDHNTDEKLLQRCIEISEAARAGGNTPFGALLADKDGNILMEQGNIELTEKKCTGHAECSLADRASHEYTKDFLWTCSLYTTAEPCVMCSGAIYWANIGRVVYAMEETRLLELTGSNEVNPTFDLPSREIYKHGQKNITVVGPFKDLEVKAAEVHQGYWD
ncbi:nucleoside deaminase [Agrilactobacillus yilanensis]|uniref:Nucleoside deaminase n=1 Tax=Agrilactobacillus yilanensis TaxID=2485997 RepID=A0ABW4J5N5_9LACO|nr:nucleoside deaminase [Agrilactobacillus yilanensis]